MTKSLGKLTLATILATLALGVPLTTFADDTNTPPAAATPAPATPAAPTAPAKPKGSVYNGKLVSLDMVNKTITVGENAKHVIQITSDTKITKGGQPATLSDGVVGEPVRVTYTKSDDGTMTAKSVRFGPKPSAN